jgi:CubicO group peptidase (beta-lactamase class C family)
MKRLLLLPVLLLMMTSASPAAAAKREMDSESKAAIDRAVAAAIELKMTPGAVVVAGRGDQIVFERAYGHKTYDPTSSAMTTDTVFDLASLSKTLGGATSIMILADEGKLSVTDPVSKYLEGMQVEDKKDITIEQLLLHRGGFVADNPMKDFKDGADAAMKKIYTTKLKYEPGTNFEYSDNSFIVLGEVVHKVAGEPLDQFAKQHIFSPLKMTSTTYNPPKEWKDRFAPTEKRAGQWISGEVHDPRSHAMGGVAGHAGIFSTGRDVARFCQMILNKGELDGVRVLKSSTVAEMIKPRCITDPKDPDVKYCRGYGFDVDSKYSSGPRGERFEKGTTVGHTGYTGTSFWLDPNNDAFVVLLTNRVHPDDDAEIKMLRKRIATIVGDALLGPKDVKKSGPTE